ncbi:MAG: YHYH protein [Gemmatimonadetes bacterium]|nr:YHYH protein [Gemmatimonadota bacterium]
MGNARFDSLARVGLASMLAFAIVGCGDTSSTTEPIATGNEVSVNPASFLATGLASPITTENCTLSGGAVTSCYRITTVGAPTNHAVGAFCPTNISDGSVAGMWIEGGKTHDLTGAFIANLATFYNDSRWKLFDNATGRIYVTDTQAAFQAAAQPNVPAAYYNHCVEGKMSYVGGGISRTYLIPVTPVALTSGTGSIGMSGVGVALNGITMDPPAPVDRIKAAFTIAAFDDCGGHINPVEGYHYHAAMGCAGTAASTDGHAALIGYALDGFGIYAMLDAAGAESTGLDNCRGHTDGTRGYHYHVAGAGENMFIGCFRGQQGTVR